MAEVSNDAAEQRYELETDDGLAIAAYSRDGDTLVFTHTQVPSGARGNGVATRLIAGALADVRGNGCRFVPQCPFVADYVERHPEVRDMLA